MDAGRPQLSIVVPLYNEQENIAELHRRVRDALQTLGGEHEILLINDGSDDATAAMIDVLSATDRWVRSIHLSRNFGHQAALCAGLDRARGGAVVVLDGDLQDPPELIPELVGLWKSGADVVYAVRRTRSEGVAKRLLYAGFYRVLGAVSDLKIPLDSGDFGLLDRRVVRALRRLPERVRFVRGLRTFVGFRQVSLEYDRPGRGAGTSKYTLGKLMGLAADGLVSFSSRPLRLVTALGGITALIAVALTVWAILDAATARTAPRGWASTLIVVLFLGSVQLLSLGIIGEYVRLIFLESKQRPTYIVAARRGTGARRRATARPIEIAP